MRVLLIVLSIVALAALPGAAQDKTASAKSSAAKAAPTPSAPININTATQAQFESLPGLGPKVAERILEYRQKNGPFKKVEDLMNVKGIGEKSFLKLKPLLTITQKTEPAAGTAR